MKIKKTTLSVWIILFISIILTLVMMNAMTKDQDYDDKCLYKRHACYR